MADITTPGARFIARIRDEYEMHADEDALLDQIGRELDLIERLDALLDESLTATGSKGQEVLSAAVAEVRHHRDLLARMLKQLGVAAAEAEAAGTETRSQQATRAARARWTKGA